MVRKTPTKATVEQTAQLATWLDSQGVTPEQSMSWLKSKHYVVKDISYNATRVATYIAGRNSVIRNQPIAVQNREVEELLKAIKKCTNVKAVKLLIAQYEAGGES